VYLYENNKFVAKVRVLSRSLDENLNGTNFNNSPSNTVFSFGSFSMTSNFDRKKNIDYTNELSAFARPITLETININETQSSILHDNVTKAVLNLDKSDLNSFVRFGSALEFLKISIQNIILTFPGSLFINSQINRGGNITFTGFTYNSITNISRLWIPNEYIVNKFNIITREGNLNVSNDNELRNLNLSYEKYIVWSTYASTVNTCKIIGYTGNTSSQVSGIFIDVEGNPFPFIGESAVSGRFDFHIKPNNNVFEEYRALLNNYEKYIISERDNIDGFRFKIKDPILLDDGTIIFNDSSLLWNTSDGYNIDINSVPYERFLEILSNIGAKYDSVKTDMIARFLTTTSLKSYDLTEEGKVTKLLRTYGNEFDEIREFIDSLVYINKVTYDKKNNIPDQLIGNLARTMGWKYFSLINEAELMSSFLSIDDTERNLTTDLLPAEVDIELWRRILINTSYFWKTKGTKSAIRAMFLMIGIPEPFVNITEYVYTVDGKIDPRQVPLTINDFPSNSLPYDNSGYPKAPLETSDFYFQVSGNTDSGQEYMNAFRMAGFNLSITEDNKKSWIQTGSTTRIHPSTRQYYQEDSKLVLNTKEIDISLDTIRGIENDVWNYISEIDYPANSSGYTLSVAYVNVSIGLTGATQSVFKLPAQYNTAEGDLEVRFNGILLNAPKTGNTGTTLNADYTVLGNEFTLTNGNVANAAHGDVIQATYVYTGGTEAISGVTIKYMVTRVNANLSGTVVPLPSMPNGDVQLTINGIALTKGTNQFAADYIVDPNNNSQIIIQNPDVIAFLSVVPYVQVTYLTVTGQTSIASRSEVTRIDSFNSGKVYFNSSANKYVYKLNYKVNNAVEVKLLVDGIALEPNKDYIVNSSNKYELFLPTGLKYGSIISAYYLVAGNDYFNPIINNDFGVGDISNLSFLEFIDLIQRRLINVRNRKTITDFKGGWYPTLLNVYVTYLKRGTLTQENPLYSNGYTFYNLYPFLSKYNAFFQKFVDELLPSTVIIRKGGLLIRNGIFTRQKFAYKRGVYMGHIDHLGLDVNATTYIADNELYYHGDDSSSFMKRQPSQNVDWTDDSVCPSICNLNVTNIHIDYPGITTTTTTTIAPTTTTTTTIPPLGLELTFDTLKNVPVASATLVSEWNTFFDLPTYGNPFTSVEVVEKFNEPTVNYGLLYNWYSAVNASEIAAIGYSVPTYANWLTLVTYLGGAGVAGGKLKELGFTYFNSPNVGATNEVGFNGRGSGYRDGDGSFHDQKLTASYLTTENYSSNQTYMMVLNNANNDFTVAVCGKSRGNSLRLFRLATVEELLLPDGLISTYYTGNNESQYRLTKIGTQIWMADDLCETKFRDDSWIPGFDGGTYTMIPDINWGALTTSALCAYDNDLANVYSIPCEITLIGGSDVIIKEGPLTNNLHLISILDLAGVIIETKLQAFAQCTNLSSVNMQGAITLSDGETFNGCSLLDEIILPNVKYINYAAFQGVIVETMYLPELLHAYDSACFASSWIKHFNLPKLLSIGTEGFYGLYSVESIYIPLCTDLGGSMSSDSVFSLTDLKTITLTIPSVLMTCNGGNPDGDILDLQMNNTVTIIEV
jgi:uncharacterized protein (TIGR02145 family)